MCFLANPITACAAHHDVMVVAFTRFLPAAEHTCETLIETTSPQHEAEAFLTSFATETSSTVQTAPGTMIVDRVDL